MVWVKKRWEVFGRKRAALGANATPPPALSRHLLPPAVELRIPLVYLQLHGLVNLCMF